MGSFFGGLGKKVSDAAQAAAKKTGEMVEITKLSLNARAEEEKIEKLYIEMGKSIYTKFSVNDVIDESFNGICAQIVEHEKVIIEIKEKIAQVKNVKECSSCGKEMEKSIKFCSSCGGKQEDLEGSDHPQEFKCTCGAYMPDGLVFCTDCGKKVEQK